MKNSMKLALCGMMAALSTVLLFLTGAAPVATLALPAIAGCLLIPVVVEVGLPWAFGVYGVCSVLGVFLAPDRQALLFYVLFFGHYPALQQAMQEMIRSKMTSVQRLERTSTTIPMDRLLDEVLDQDIDILKRTKENVDREAFYRAADALVNAKKVYVLGAGSSLALATFMAHYLRLVFETVHLVEATSEATILQQMVHVGEGDAVIAISFPRYSKKAVKTMKYASSQKATTVAITDSPLSPLAQYASHVLLARSDMVSFVDSLVGPLSILNALIVTVAIKKKNEVADTLRKIEEIWDEYGVYEKVDEKGS